MNTEMKRKIFSLLESKFETELVKNYFLEMTEHIPDYIFTMPSSTSGKFHNKTQCEKYGQLYHIFMFASILEHRLRLKWNKELFATPEIRDCMRCIPVFHDAVKCGWNGSKYTVQDHPMLAAEWVRNTKVQNDIPGELKEMIAGMCEAHSGEWNKSRAGNEIMPEPRNEMEFFIHECDILSSRSDIDWIIPDELKTLLGEVKEELPDINEYQIPFGKYKGKTLVEIAACDPGYIAWAKENMQKEPIKTLLCNLTNGN